MEDSNDRHYRLDKEGLDSLRMEAQVATPEEQKEFVALVNEAHDKFLSIFSEYIDEADVLDDIDSRFILIDDDQHELVNNTWKNIGPDDNVHSYLKEGEVGQFSAIGEGEFVIGIPIDVWDKLNDENKKDLINSNGSEEGAKKFVQKAINWNGIAHEITHLYQPLDKLPTIPLWLIECQAYWVGRELADEDFRVHNEEYDKIADFYQTLLDKYGDEVHEICLSKNKGTNRATLSSIKSEFTDEIQKDIFPNLK